MPNDESPVGRWTTVEWALTILTLLTIAGCTAAQAWGLPL